MPSVRSGLYQVLHLEYLKMPSRNNHIQQSINFVSDSFQFVLTVKVRGVFCLCNVNIIGFYYLFNMLHISVIRPSSGRNIFARTYSTDNGSVVFRILVNMNSYSDRFG
jgi:hypothetical protein